MQKAMNFLRLGNWRWKLQSTYASSSNSWNGDAEVAHLNWHSKTGEACRLQARYKDDVSSDWGQIQILSPSCKIKLRNFWSRVANRHQNPPLKDNSWIILKLKHTTWRSSIFELYQLNVTHKYSQYVEVLLASLNEWLILEIGFEASRGPWRITACRVWWLSWIDPTLALNVHGAWQANILQNPSGGFGLNADAQSAGTWKNLRGVITEN